MLFHLSNLFRLPSLAASLAVLAAMVAARHLLSPAAGRLLRSVWVRVDRWGNRVSAVTWLPYALIFCTSLLVCLLGALRGVAAPEAHDEFSYLLAADTFVRGRLTNPTPACWEHFETFHVLMRPTYASKYPPMQGLTLALGQVLTGHPIAGVWLGVAAGCTAVYWALRGGLPRRWAGIGALICVLHPLIFDWSQSYWGGGVAVFGGALVLGAALRIAGAPRALPLPGRRFALHALMLGCGLAILANTRPFEGAIVGLILCVFAARSIWRSRGRTAPERVAVLLRAAAVAAVPLVLAVCWMAVYNRAVTGSPLRMPYMEHTKQYEAVPLFLFQKVSKAPGYADPTIASFYSEAIRTIPAQYATPSRTFQAIFFRICYALTFLFEFPLLLFSLAGAAPWLGRLSRREHGPRRPAAWVSLAGGFGFFIVLISLCNYMLPHYTAPAVPLMLLLSLQGLRALCYSGGSIARTSATLRLVQFLVLLLALLLFLGKVGTFLSRRQSGDGSAWAAERVRLQQSLIADGRKHLVIVRYLPKHSHHSEWVYNRADIASAVVVWARDRGAEANARLIASYPGRAVHLLTVDDDLQPPVLSEYPSTRRGGL